MPLYCFPRKGDFPVRYQLVSVLSALLLCLTMLAAIVYGVGTQHALEQTHMADVRRLFSLCRRFSLGSILLTLVGWLYSRKQRFFWRIVRRTACCMLAFVAILALLAAMDFDRLFILFHQIAFTNNLWLLNPQTDLLIRLMPTQLFIDYAQIIGIVWAALMGILLIIATMKLRNQQ